NRIRALALDPRDGSMLWAATSRGLQRTHDRGLTWTRMAMPSYRIATGVVRAAELIGFYPDATRNAATAAAGGTYEVNDVVLVLHAEPVLLAGTVAVARSADDGGRWDRASITAKNVPGRPSHLRVDRLAL